MEKKTELPKIAHISNIFGEVTVTFEDSKVATVKFKTSYAAADFAKWLSYEAKCFLVRHWR